MLSILIPTYNYNVYPLVYEINEQCIHSKIEFEILCLDDHSSYFTTENQQINTLEHCQFLINEKNVGRTQNRLILTNKAKYNLLLFLDADVFPEKKNFIANYLQQYTSNTTYFGGFTHCKSKLTDTNYLRYNYGRKREEKSASVRNQNPYGAVSSGNMLIEKDIFLKCNFNENIKVYGLDIFFAYKLYLNKYKVVHIDNYLFHNGLENNQVFFEKSLESVYSRKMYLEHKAGIENVNSLIKHYKVLKKLKLTVAVTVVFKCLEPILKSLIFKKQPNLVAFDLYRLGYICSLK